MLYLIILTFLIAPGYVVRFNLINLPTNLLMMWVFFIWAVWLGIIFWQNRWMELLEFFKNFNKKLLLFIGLFFLSGVISLFVNGASQAKLGQFIVLFLQPISLFFIVAFHLNHAPQNRTFLLSTFYFLLAATGLYAILQYFTLIGLPSVYWGNSSEPKRALSFFLHPNFYALWSAPLLALLIPDLMMRIKNLYVNRQPASSLTSQGGLLIVNCFLALVWLFGALGLLVSMSRAGWLGLAGAILVYAIAAADKKIRRIILGGVVVMVIVIVSVPNLYWRIAGPFYGTEKSANSRIALWQSGLRAIKTSPVLGLGLNGYGNNYNLFQTNTTLDTHNYPHNIFLNFWVETGLIGLISFIGLISLYIHRGLKTPQEIFKLSIALFLITLLFQGLIDNPYFKNDLAMVFWMVLALEV